MPESDRTVSILGMGLKTLQDRFRNYLKHDSRAKFQKKKSIFRAHGYFPGPFPDPNLVGPTRCKSGSPQFQKTAMMCVRFFSVVEDMHYGILMRLLRFSLTPQSPRGKFEGLIHQNYVQQIRFQIQQGGSRLLLITKDTECHQLHARKSEIAGRLTGE